MAEYEMINGVALNVYSAEEIERMEKSAREEEDEQFAKLALSLQKKDKKK